MGLLSDVLVIRSPVHLLGCAVGAVSLSLLTTVKGNTHTPLLKGYLTTFNIFENGATIVIACILCDIGKDQIVLHEMKALATISGVSDGVAGFGSILGQLLTGPVESNYGWKAAFAMFSLAAILACLPALPYTIG
jgi:sugar phosphate permease